MFQDYGKDSFYLVSSVKMGYLFRKQILVYKKTISLIIKLLDFSFVSAQYAVSLYRYIKEWRKNPQWSLSCCLGLLLPLKDLQGELRGLAEANVFKNQLQTGEIEKPSVLSTIKNSGVIDVTLEEGEHDNEKIVNIQDETHADTVYRKARRHQGTQTELYSIPITGDLLVHGSNTDSDEERL